MNVEKVQVNFLPRTIQASLKVPFHKVKAKSLNLPLESLVYLTLEPKDPE